MSVLIEIAPFLTVLWIAGGIGLVWVSRPRGWRYDVPFVIFWPFYLIYEVSRAAIAKVKGLDQ